MRRPTHSGSPVALTPVEFHVLLSLADGERHGYAILQEVAHRTDDQLRLRTGTLYTVIKRMLDSGWIDEVDSPADETDERRRYYGVTSAGRDVLRAEAKRLESLVRFAHEKRVLGRSRKLAPERGR
jgi:DNA-binding PadR family transcriptional regulator